MNRFFYCIIWLLAVTCSVYAQPGFIYSENVQEINFPQLDICLTLPAHAGFKASLPAGRNAFLEMESQIYYYFDLAHADDVDATEVKFTLTAEDEADCLSMYVLPAGEKRVKQEINYLIETSPAGAYRVLPSVSAEAGTFNAFRMQFSDSRVYDTYILSDGNYSYMFRLNGNLPASKRTGYESLLLQLKKKTLAYRRTRYESRIQSNPFAFAGDENAKEIKLAEGQGILLTPSAFTWTEPGLSLVIPAGFKYRMREGSSSLDRFYDRDISVHVADYSSRNNAESNLNLRIEAAAYTDTIEIVVDDMPVDAVYYGGKEAGSLLFFIEGDEGVREISFGEVTNRTIPAIERIISSIRLGIPKYGLHTRRSESISSLLKLEGPNDVSLDKPVPLGDFQAGNVSNCDLVDLGIRLQLTNGCTYNYEIDKNRFGETKQERNKTVRGKPQNSLRIWNVEPDNPSYVITKEEMKPPLKTDLQEKKREWTNYKNTEVIHASLTRVNGIEWSLFFFKAGEKSYGGIMTAYKGDYTIVINIPYQTEKEAALKKAAYIKSVWFKVIPTYS